MRNRNAPLLAELHAHTTWSDGELTPAELVDLYGTAGFDVLAITDHVLPGNEVVHVREGNFAAYLEEVNREAERARHAYGLLVIPGLELTFEHPDPGQAAHAVAVGLHRFVGLDEGLDAALARARSLGAVLVAAHPYALERAGEASRLTARFAVDVEWARTSVDRFELFNRDELFPWVAEQRLPAVANGDFHRREHLETWKTLLPCEPNEEAVLEHLRSALECGLTRVGRARRAERRAA
jgi:3',5'-nucleoside bisphosphate phosphatase